MNINSGFNYNMFMLLKVITKLYYFIWYCFSFLKLALLFNFYKYYFIEKKLKSKIVKYFVLYFHTTNNFMVYY